MSLGTSQMGDLISSKPSSAVRRPRVLVVDDQAINIQSLYRIFEKDCQVLMATTGPRALVLCEQQQPDVVLLDVMMPGMDGHQVCSALKAHPRTADIPVIFVTAQHEPADEAKGLALGAVDFISKPFHAEVVRARVMTHLALKAKTDQLRANEEGLELAASVFTHAREGIMITNVRGTILDVNDSFVRITGYGRDEVIGQNPRILKSGQQSPEFYAEMWQTISKQGHWSGELWNRNKRGELYAELLTISAVMDERGLPRHFVALFTDITPMKVYQKRLEDLARFDTLTGLANRMSLADRLQLAIAQSDRRQSPLAVVFLDLDGFKQVNDQHGHDTGDAVLVQVSRRMKAVLRDGDTLARMGGDEFVAVLVDIGQAGDCRPVVERLLLAASEPMAVGSLTLQVSASVGVTVYPQDPAEAEVLIRHADQAMYIAKQAGKNQFHCYTPPPEPAAV